MEIVREGEVFQVATGHEWFWPGFADGSWEPTTFQAFDKILAPDSTMLDIGAWIGPTALYAARRCKEVFAFEPDPTAFASLIQNLNLNKVENVTPYPVAVSTAFKAIPFGPKTGYGDSMSSQIWAKDDTKVAAISFTALLNELRPDFVKIDIEGGEKFLFEGNPFALHRPTLHLSLHTPSFLDDVKGFKEAVMKGLERYDFFYDENLKPIELETAFNPHAFNAVIASTSQIV